MIIHVKLATDLNSIIVKAVILLVRTLISIKKNQHVLQFALMNFIKVFLNAIVVIFNVNSVLDLLVKIVYLATTHQ